MKKQYFKKEYKDIIRRSVTLCAMMIISINLFAAGNFQWKKIDVNMQKGTLSSLLQIIEKETGCNIIYINSVIEKYNNITIKKTDSTVEDILKEALKGTELRYSIENNTVTLSSTGSGTRAQSQPQTKPESKITIVGKVIDKDTKKPIAGATVIVNNGTKGAISDGSGGFSVVTEIGDNLSVSFVGYKSIEHKVTAKSVSIVFSMENNIMGVDDVVVTGIYTRKKESFTGSAATYTNKDLKMVGSTNLLQSLRTLDPTFVMLDSKQFGSNPNRLPDIEIRGTTSITGLKTEFGEDPNRPLFVLDGVECRLEDVMNLNMDRVESITVLKDAASTAIYGSKAANGVVVIETVQPKPGKLRLSYNGNFAINYSDLSDYNLMNSAEKLEFERVAGVYEATDKNNIGNQLYRDAEYNRKLMEIRRGVDTYWLSEPLRTVLNNTHNLSIDGGEGAMRYSIAVNYNGNNGVMKGSARDVIGADMTLSYRTKKLIFTNRFGTTISSSENEPIVFSEYSKQNPYYRKTGENGDPLKYLINTPSIQILNPLYLSQYKNDDDNHENLYRNTFTIEWIILPELRVRSMFSVNSMNSRNITFKSPNSPVFEKLEPLKKGSYSNTTTRSFNYEGNVNITYGKLFKEKHMVNLVGGWNFKDNLSTSEGYSVIGFASDYHKNPQYSAGFTEGQTPRYSENKTRATSFFANANYSYDNRYLFDANIRMDGTSRFGSNNLFSTTWAFGLAWNIHNEKFIKELNWINNFKIRGSIGNPGNQNFDAYIAYKTYAYNNNAYQNMFGTGAVISNFGNKNLEWQRTLDRNIGVDLTILNNSLILGCDFYYKTTDPLLISISVPASTGTQSLTSNLGGQIAKGMSGAITGFIFKRENFSWNLNFNFRVGSVKYMNIGRTLDKLNSESQDVTNKDTENFKLKTLLDSDILKRYYDGADVNDLYSVISLGIDPASGREVFLDNRGEQTFQYRQMNERLVGNSRPDVEGVLGTSLFYKGFTFNMSLRYSLGAEQMASALYNKVENISSEQLKFNQDKRALYERWQKPGDIAKFSSIKNVGTGLITPMSSRFLVQENYLSFESISLGYETTAKWLKTVGVQGANITAYFSNIGRITSLKEERGIDYPFARTITFSIGVRF